MQSTGICNLYSSYSKKETSECVADYRPISLCKVIYNLVTKIITNKMKLVLSNIISSNQSAFVLGKIITDNVLFDFEILHSMNKKSNGYKGFMALNLGISKTYDCVKWRFVC